MEFLENLIKEVGSEYAQLAEDISEDEIYVDTGSFMLNALVSGSLFGGVSGNKITTFSGANASGKTFFSLAVVKNYLEMNPEGYCLYFDTEAAVTRKMLSEKGIDLSRVVVLNVVTVEEFRTKALKAVDIYMKKPEEERRPCMFVLDSLGMLSTNKEINDTLAGEEKRDMTRAQLTKAAFRMLTLKLGKANIPMIVTNHIYANVGGYGPAFVQSSGSGMQYSASTIVELTKSKEKDGTEIVGSIIKAKTFKSRLSRENQEVSVRLYYDHRGLDRYYGLLDIGEESGIIPRVGNRYEINGKKIGKNVIYANPEEYFTPELLEKLDAYAQKKFKYGSSLTEDPVVEQEPEPIDD
jgi:RecA/RadA recombinase